MSSQARDLTPLQRAFLHIERLEAKLAATREPIAVLGMGCRFPGGVRGPEDFWRLLVEGRDAVREVPAARWTEAQARTTDPRNPGHASVRRGGFLDAVDTFDAGFFGVSPLEADGIDPQHALLLEVSWETLERAMIRPDRLRGSRTGLYVGIYNGDFEVLQRRDVRAADVYTAPGIARSFGVGRLAHLLDLHGPALSVDTACSSSLTAVHLACQALRARECDLALAGGVNLMLSPDLSLLMARMQALSPRGRCSTFDASADGFVRGEGCGMVALKRLSDATRAGDPVLAVICGSAVNQDGRGASLTAPNGAAQRLLLREALANAGLRPEQVEFIETHGTGTALGDPIEVEALRDVYGAGGARPPLMLGALKSNLGHLEPAAGIAGLIKAVLVLGNEAVPPNLHFEALNPQIDGAGAPFVIPVEPRPWPRREGRRHAAVSSFGMSGTIAHVVVGEGPPPEPAAAPASATLVLPLSAPDPAGLSRLAAEAVRWLAAPSAPPWHLACDAFSRGRAAFAHRLAVAAGSCREAAERLQAWSRSGAAPGVFTGSIGGSIGAIEKPRIAFLFPGGGAQYAGMGAELYAAEPVFQAAVDRCAEQLRGSLARDVRDLMFAPEQDKALDAIDHGLPALFTLEYALTELWASWGVVPDVVLGHSMGEYVAACAAGRLELAEGLLLVRERSRLMKEKCQEGAMVAVEAAAAWVRPRLAGFGEALSVAAVNGPEDTVVGGTPDAVAAFAAACAVAGVRHRMLALQVGAHSPLVEPALQPFGDAVARVGVRRGAIPLASSFTGTLLDPAEMFAPDHWPRHLREPVRFWDALERVDAEGVDVYLEIGPHPTLTGLAAKSLPGSPGRFVASLRRGKGELGELRAALAQLHVLGVEPRWDRICGVAARVPVDVPTYPFAATRRKLVRAALPSSEPASGDGLLGRPLRSPALRGAAFESELHAGSRTWLRDHVVFSAVVVPGVAWLDAAARAAEQVLGGPVTLADVMFHEMLAFDDGERRVVQVLVEPDGDGAAFRVVSTRPGETSWTLHAGGKARLRRAARVAAPELAEAERRCTTPLDVTRMYDDAHARGLQLTGAFRAVTSARRGVAEAVSDVAIPEALAAEHPAVHPALLDGCIHGLGFDLGPASDTFVPLAIEEAELPRARCARVRVHTAYRPGEPLTVDITIHAADGEAIGRLTGVRTARATLEATQRALRRCFYQKTWEDTPSPAAPPPTPGEGPWLVFANDDEGARRIAALKRRGREAVAAPRGLCSEPARLRALLETCRPSGVVYAEQAASASPTAWRPTTEGALHVCRALAASSLPPPRLRLVTRRAQAVGSEIVRPEHALVWGLGAVVALEEPALRCVRIDVGDDVAPDRLVESILAEDGEGEVALRERRSVARLVACPPRVDPAAPLRADATYLVTGGLGALGLETAASLVERGARHLALAGRTPPGAAAAVRIAAWAALGVQVSTFVVDVSSEAETLRLVDDLARRLPPLRGIFHAAGVLDDGMLAEQSWARFETVLGPKAVGAWNLHRATRALPLDWFVLYSSGTSLLGNPGQANYAAANAFLDAMAHWRRAHGLPAVSVNWGAWAEGGLAADLVASQAAGLAGMTPFSAAQGRAVIGLVDAAGPAQQGAFVVDWPTFASRFAGAQMPRLLERLCPAAPAIQGSDAERLREALRAAAPPRRRDLLEALLRSEVARVLGQHEVDPARPLRELGMDSLMTVQLRNSLGAAIDLALPATLVFEHPTLEALARHLSARFEPPVAHPRAEAPPPPEPASDLAALTDEEAEAQLAAQLETWNLAKSAAR